MSVLKKKAALMTCLNILVLIILGLLLQLGGAYLVNAAVILMGDGGAVSDAGSAATAAANQYSDYMAMIRAMEPRQIIHSVFVAPLVEELVFRLIFLRAGKMILPFWAANLIQAALFGFNHNVTYQKIYGFVMGLIIGCVFYYCPLIYRNAHSAEEDSARNTGSRLLDLPNSLFGVMITLLLHMVINTSGIYLIPLFPPDAPIAFQIATGIVCMLVSTAAVFTLYLQSRSKA